jgi:DNA polymerase I-like protein with 3'-5' exonuclease and polymerase domains
MPICNVDARALEVYCAAYLSKDKLLCQELIDGVDIHSVNQEALGLPSRGIAKIFIFRILYGGTEYSFANDPEFAEVSTSKDYWKKVIENFYSKYKGVAKWHNEIVQTVTQTGVLVSPTGRQYQFERDRRGEWPVTQIKNFIVQGLGADIMAIARVSFHNRFKAGGFTGVEINTIHDSIVVDCPSNEVDAVVRLFHEVFRDLPINFEHIFKTPFDLPLRCEVGVGDNAKELKEVKVA